MKSEIVLTLPFGLILLTIAIFPLISHRLWERNITKVFFSALYGIPVIIYLLATDYHKLLHTAEEYFSFISLITSLFMVSSGIFISIKDKASPLINASILIAGAILANLIGTTGASMVLIRPFLRINRWRKNTFHLPVFFIFIVSNVGGGLTPVGDPPLFMGFLKGVPFFWTLKSLFPIWLTEISILIVTFIILDWIALKSEERQKIPEIGHAIRFEGKRNFLFLIFILLSVIFLKFPFREVCMWISAILSFSSTPAEIRKKNEFSFYPAQEVAIVFAGIFATMPPVLELIRANAEKFGISEPWQFFFITGLLSSFLDNAPTYLTFFAMALGLTEKLLLSPAVAGVYELYLKAISCGAVFFGANTYIGNAPNFMVKSISEGMGIRTPNFISYLIWSFIILLPSFVLVAHIFFGFLK